MYTDVCQCIQNIHHMPNVPLPYISVSERMPAYEDMLAYADGKGCSVNAFLAPSTSENNGFLNNQGG